MPVSKELQDVVELLGQHGGRYQLQVYDNNVNRDYCDACSRNYRMHKEGCPPGRNSYSRGYPISDSQ